MKTIKNGILNLGVRNTYLNPPFATDPYCFSILPQLYSHSFVPGGEPDVPPERRQDCPVLAGDSCDTDANFCFSSTVFR